MQQYEFKSKGAQIRSRIQFLEEGAKNALTLKNHDSIENVLAL